MAKKDNKGLIAFIIVLALALAAGIFQLALSLHSKSSVKEFSNPPKENSLPSIPPVVKFKSSNSTESFKNRKNEYVAKLVISGTIQSANQTYNQKWLLKTIDGLKNDPNNKGIILCIDSPGGTVYEADEVYLALMDYKKESNRPIYAYLESMAASGGYYIACAADKITANRNCITGSIGVIAGQFVDLTELMDRYGIKAETIHSGKNKTIGSYTEALTDEQRQIMKSISDECYEQFTKIVSSSRNMKIQDVEKLADGRPYTAKQALLNGLIDYIGDFKLCFDAMDRKEFDFKDYPVYTYQYEKTQNFYDMILGLSKEISKTANQDSTLPAALEKFLEKQVSFPAYYFESSRF